MSVLIKGMKMPKACINCDVHIAHDYCDHFAQFGTGPRKDGRYDDCPLIEIPTPHGRLIDADVLQREAYQKNFDGIISDMALFNLNYYLEEKAQTILEAEE